MTTIQQALAQGIQRLTQYQGEDKPRPYPTRQNDPAFVQGRGEACPRPGDLILQGRSDLLDAQLLLSHVLHVERSTLYAYPERELTPAQEQQFLALIERRAQDEPVAYLVGHKEFYGLDLIVDRRVLIPRPETELLVETALHVCRQKITAGSTPVVADIGTGSGAIPIALAVNEPRLPYLYAIDISSDALAVASLNCQRHHVQQRVRLLQGDLIAPLPEPVDVLTANLPYVGTNETALLTPDVHDYEPHLALFSGPEGLDHIKRLLTNVATSNTLKAEAVILLEIGYQQRERLTQVIEILWPRAKLNVYKDYAGWDRVLEVNLNG
jgi:release factor glutamine methyltransferase